MSSWDLPEVAEAQRKVGYGEVEAFHKGRVFTYMAMALTRIHRFDEMHLVDLGCGVGHYGALIGQLWPDMRYTGLDPSPAMIEVAQTACTNEKAEFFCLDVEEYLEYLYMYDVALHTQALEYAEDPREAFLRLLYEGPRYIILHKLRFTSSHDAPSTRLMEPTYCGNEEEVWLWNKGELGQMVRDYPRTRHVQVVVPWYGEEIETWLIS